MRIIRNIKKIPPIVVWAIMGFAFVALQLYAYGSWIFSDSFMPIDPGNDPIPMYSLVSMRAFEVVSSIALIATIIWFVKGIKRSGRIDIVRLMMIGWISAYWLDPFLNFLRPMFTYNAYLFNMGSWANFIPGFIAPNGSKVAEPLLVDPANYFVTFTATVMAGVLAMKKAKEKWPNVNIFVQSLCAIPAIWIAMGVLDVVATRFLHFDAWLITKWDISLWGGNFYQFPLYEFIVFPLAFLACALLVYHQDKEGYTVIERGYNQLNLPSWVITILRILAVIAFCNIANWAYTALMGLTALGGDPWPANTPSWLANQQIPFRIP